MSSQARVRKRIYLQFAMSLECEPLLKGLAAKSIQYNWADSFPFQFYSAEFKSLDLIIALAGNDPVHGVDSIGSVPAAVLAAFSLRELRPELVLNPGTCGGFLAQGHLMGEVLIGSQYVAFHGRRIDIPAMPSMRDYGIGKYPVANSDLLRKHLALRDGIVSSGDALDYSAEDQEYMAAHRGTLKEMEAAAIAWICQTYQVPLIPVKAVTDFVDHHAATADQFMTNYGAAVQNLKLRTLQILDYLESHPQDPAWNFPG